MLRTWTIYKYTCPRGDCELPNPTYIGQTRNTLRKRLTQHCKDGAIKEHNTKAHKIETNQSDIQSNTIPIKQFDDLHRLLIYEALSILEERPDLNRQRDNFVNPLKLYSRTLHRTQQNPQCPPPPNTATTSDLLPNDGRSPNFNEEDLSRPTVPCISHISLVIFHSLVIFSVHP